MSRGGKRKNAGRKAGPPKVALRLRVLPETYRTLDLLAFAKDQPRGAIVDQLARRAVRKKSATPCTQPPTGPKP